jgi:hypothetical protein
MLAAAIAATSLCGLLAIDQPHPARAAAAPGHCPPAATAATRHAAPSTGARAPAPGQVLACVGSLPITGATYDHWIVIAERADRAPDKPSSSKSKLRRPNHAIFVNEVMSFLISSDWVLDEAAARGLDLPAAKVRRSFDQIRKQQFPKKSEFRKFLKQTGETVADLLLRVKLNMASQLIQQQVLAGQTGEAGQKLLSSFAREFRAKGKSETYCARRYATQDCGHLRSSL